MLSPECILKLQSASLGVTELAIQNGWSAIRTEGYVDGLSWRTRGFWPSLSNLVGIEDYCLGFREGYFVVDCEPTTDRPL